MRYESISINELGQYGEFELRQEIVPDEDTRIEDFDGYTDKQIAAWRKDEWCFVTRHVIATKAGIALGHAYLPGTEYGQFPCTTEDDELIETSLIFGDELAEDTRAFCADLIEQAIAEAQAKLAELTK